MEASLLPIIKLDPGYHIAHTDAGFHTLFLIVKMIKILCLPLLHSFSVVFYHYGYFFVSCFCQADIDLIHACISGKSVD